MNINYKLIEKYDYLVSCYLSKDLPFSEIKKLSNKNLDSVVKWYALRTDEGYLYNLLKNIINNTNDLERIISISEEEVYAATLSCVVDKYMKNLCMNFNDYIKKFDIIYCISDDEDISNKEKVLAKYIEYLGFNFRENIIEELINCLKEKPIKILKTDLYIYKKNKYTEDYYKFKEFLKDISSLKCLILPKKYMKLKMINMKGRITSLEITLDLGEGLRVFKFFVRRNRIELHNEEYISYFLKHFNELEYKNKRLKVKNNKSVIGFLYLILNRCIKKIKEV